MVTCHDGFTLHDLVSYNVKHNLGNGEQNRDGSDNNHSHNYGAEGETDNKDINLHRQRQKRNILATLFLAQGAPMILAGDEHGNSQGGNNNAYCQDNPTGWINKDNITPEGKELHAFTKNLIALRKQHDALCAAHFLHGAKKPGADADISWRRRDGGPMRDGDWQNKNADCFAMMLNEDAIQSPDKPDSGKRLMAVFNRSAAPQEFTLPACEGARGAWQKKLDTDARTGAPDDTLRRADGQKVVIAPHSVAVFARGP